MSQYTYATSEQHAHLGGNFVEGDPATFCPTAWEYIIKEFGIKSVLDVGSGRGYAAQWFKGQGLEVTAIEGLHDNVANSLVPAIEHDLTLSPFVKQVDFVNCIEVVEHIEERYLDNLLTTLCNGKYLLMTHAVPGQPGYHHVNCQPSEYWIEHLANRGFTVLREQSKQVQRLAKEDRAKHIGRNGMLFRNDN